jgi:hypothetical protein
MTEKFYVLQCSCCKYIPDEDDIVKTKYSLGKCDCGQDDVCDLCLNIEMGKYICPKCSSVKAMGKNRKKILKEEYK